MKKLLLIPFVSILVGCYAYPVQQRAIAVAVDSCKQLQSSLVSVEYVATYGWHDRAMVRYQAECGNGMKVDFRVPKNGNAEQ